MELFGFLQKSLLIFCFVGFVYYCDGSELRQYDAKNDDSVKDVKASESIYDTTKLPIESKKDVPISEADRVKMTADAIGKLDFGFFHAFIAALSVIIVSELGDKTFFIAAIMAMRHSRLVVFVGAIGALGVMTVLSVVLGYAFTIIPRKITFYISTALFAIFGLKMLKEGYEMDPDEGQEELEEVQAELKKKEAEMEASETTQDIETGILKSKLRQSRLFRVVRRFCSPIFIQSFTLTFLAEWGDRSQLATIILGTRENPIAVTIGGILGHSLCTGLAVLGGRLIAQRISVRTVTLIGGVVFLIFAFSALFIGDTG